ncbi:hypothetical protein [Clostridioides difficile]|uniref:hypothetical protein n=1 Tax=Clostridioides difficile TaxID=1496 RepID=UPI000D1D8793|nr:hypothetical protein [Clostridioides difficile]HBE9444626.1 hypothetical protein [Clostridioides difficile]
MRFEIGKTYVFDKQKYLNRQNNIYTILGINSLKNMNNYWMKSVDGIEFTISENDLDKRSYSFKESEEGYPYSVSPNWCIEVNKMTI